MFQSRRLNNVAQIQQNDAIRKRGTSAPRDLRISAPQNPQQMINQFQSMMGLMQQKAKNMKTSEKLPGDSTQNTPVSFNISNAAGDNKLNENFMDKSMRFTPEQIIESIQEFRDNVMTNPDLKGLRR